MNYQSRKLATSALALGLLIGAGGEVLRPQRAQASPPSRAQVESALERLTNISGCRVSKFPSESSNLVEVSCSNQAVASLLTPYLSESGFQIYADRGWSGKTRMDWRIGPQSISAINFRQPASRSVVLGNNPIYRYVKRLSPLDIRVKVNPRIRSTRESVTAIPGGLQLSIPFSRATLYCEGDPAVVPGGWLDHSCPDFTWRNPKINVNLIFNRDLTLSRATAASTSGTFDLGGINIISIADLNRIVTNYANNGVQQLIPTANSYISKFAKASVISKYSGLPEYCINLSYSNDKLNFSIPLQRDCARAVGLPEVLANLIPEDGGETTPRRASQSLKLDKSYRIKDDETFSDEFKNYTTTKTISVNRGEVSNFKRSNQSNSPRHCAGGEVRLEDWDRVEVDSNGVAKLWIAMELYEGTSCDSPDLDGQYREIDRGHNRGNRAAFIEARPGQTVTKTKKVNNTAEGGDYGQITYTLTNNNR